MSHLTCRIGSPPRWARTYSLSLTYYAIQEPDLYNRTQHFFHKGTGTKHRRHTVITRAFNKATDRMGQMVRTVNHKVGSWAHHLSDRDQRVGLSVSSINAGKKRRKSVIGYTLSSSLIATRSWLLPSQLAFCQWPMLCPPVDWTNDDPVAISPSQSGSQPDDPQGWCIGVQCKQGDMPLAMLNNLQQQAYKINPLIFSLLWPITSTTNVHHGRQVHSDAPMPIPENMPSLMILRGGGQGIQKGNRS